MENLPSDLPTYAIRFLPSALRAANSAVTFVHDNCGKVGNDAEEYARTFRAGLYSAIGTLATFPARFSAAAEASKMALPSVRAMPYQKRAGGPTWRVLYRIYEADENDAARVEIVTIRHGAQKPLTKSEGRDIDAANR